jgi:hypothetical protein
MAEVPIGIGLASVALLALGAAVLLWRERLVSWSYRNDSRSHSLDEDELLAMYRVKVWLIAGTSLTIGLAVLMAGLVSS